MDSKVRTELFNNGSVMQAVNIYPRVQFVVTTFKRLGDCAVGVFLESSFVVVE